MVFSALCLHGAAIWARIPNWKAFPIEFSRFVELLYSIQGRYRAKEIMKIYNVPSCQMHSKIASVFNRRSDSSILFVGGGGGGGGEFQ